MKIGIDGRLWNETGVGRYIRNLVEELQTLDKKNDYVLFVKKGNQQVKIQQRNWKVIETDIHWHSLAEQIKFPQVLEKEKLDLVHFPYFSLPIFYKKPFVVTIHDLIINHFPTGKASTLPYPLYQVKRIGYNAVLHHAVTHAEKIIVPLHAVESDVITTLHAPREKIVVTYEGVNVSLGAKHTQKKIQHSLPENYFLYVGNAYPHKNLDTLLDSFVQFRKDHQDVSLVLVGKDDYFYKQLTKRIATEAIDGVIFQHNVSDQELFALYSHAIAFISASYMEGFGLPPLEALSSGCVVVLSDIPSFKEVCQDSAFYFDPYSATALKKQMQIVYNLDHKKKQVMLSKGLQRVKEFSWTEMAEHTLRIYESSLSLRSR